MMETKVNMQGNYKQCSGQVQKTRRLNNWRETEALQLALVNTECDSENTHKYWSDVNAHIKTYRSTYNSCLSVN